MPDPTEDREGAARRLDQIAYKLWTTIGDAATTFVPKTRDGWVQLPQTYRDIWIAAAAAALDDELISPEEAP